MRKLTLLSAAAAIATASVATWSFAQTPDAKKKAPPPADKQPAAPAEPAAKPMAAPKPAPELAALAKTWQGTWKCEGTMPAGPMGPEHKVKATLKMKLDLDKFWLVGTYAEKKTPENPRPFAFQDWWTFDSAAKKWNRVTVDNMGGYIMFSSTSATEAKMEFEGRGAMGGTTISVRETIEMTGPKAVHVTGQVSMDGKQWMPAWDLTCKK